jgi:tetratricopeptide (TPR) repeat protein
MLKSTITLLLLAALIIVTGCATTSGLFTTTTEQLIEEHQYQKAIELIEAEIPTNTVFLLETKALAAQHKKAQLLNVNQLINNKQWGEAREILKQLQANQPTLVLERYYSDIDKAQREEERHINTQRALLEAQLLDVQFSQENLYERIHYKRINWFSTRHNLLTKKQALAEELLQLSTQALLVKDYTNAQKTYEKAIYLDPNLGAGEITHAINAGLSNLNNKAISERQSSLIRQLNNAIKKDNFDSLLIIQDILTNELFSGPEVEAALLKANKTRAEHAQVLDKSASIEYRKGNISTALIQWQQALKLSPQDSNLKERLARAEKVQRKLDKLTQSDESSD